ncbi:MAG: SseB family protein, partial [Ruminococcus sp.]|nr:SseB family protein [Ruminococcus sp.]
MLSKPSGGYYVMSTIQELAVKLSQTAEPSERDNLAGQIIQLLKTQQTVWSAFCPATKHYFLAQEEKQITAYVFSTEETCRAFTEALRKRHILLEVLKNEQEHRMFLFAELFRCGVTQVVIDSAEDYYAVPLSELIPIPDYSKLPLVQRPVLNPTVTGKMLLLTQDMRWGRADGNTELDALQEIYHSPFLHPFRKEEASGTEIPGIYSLPDNGGSLFMIFSDLYSLKQANPNDYPHAKIVRFADLHKMLADNPDKLGIIINPGSGAPMLLDMQLLELTQKSAEGDLADITVKSMNENSGKIIVTKPEM